MDFAHKNMQFPGLDSFAWESGIYRKITAAIHGKIRWIYNLFYSTKNILLFAGDFI